jgi:hypothetical protein
MLCILFDLPRQVRFVFVFVCRHHINDALNPKTLQGSPIRILRSGQLLANAIEPVSLYAPFHHYETG